MENPNERRHRNNRARQRYDDRQRKKQAMVTRTDDDSPQQTPRKTVDIGAFLGGERWQEARAVVADLWWHLRYRTPLPRLLLGMGGAMVGVLLLTLFFSPAIGYNVWALGVRLEGKTIDEAAVALQTYWSQELRIDLVFDGQVVRQVRPSELGLGIDALQIAQDARALGWSGFPFGAEVSTPILNHFGRAQTLLLELVDEVYQPAYEAGYAWQGETLISVAGKASRELDVMLTAEAITQTALTIIKTKRLDLLVKTTPPNIMDASPYLEAARAFLSQSFKLVGYDPFLDESFPWTSSRDEITRWLAAGNTGLTLRDSTFRQFVMAVNAQLRSTDQPRYLDERETLELVRQAIAANRDTVYLRVRYLPTTFQIGAGDWGQRISRRTGLPFRLIENVNPAVNWNRLSIGTVINLPSRDLLLPEQPIPNKRIVVDLDRRWMVAYENEEAVFSWRISPGRPDAPTYPGIFQILTHNEVAYGSGFSLCGDTGCSQWEMYWFMGIYEVIPGLMNGFHGAVLLPNGAYLDNGQIGNASTFGCVMSSNQQAEALFRWAEKGTIVEIISVDFPPQSNLARQAQDLITRTLSGL